MNLIKKAKNKFNETIKTHQENSERNKFIEDEFNKEAISFTVHHENEKSGVFNIFTQKKIKGILIEKEGIIRINSNLKNEEGLFLKDEKNNNYYVKIIHPLPYKFIRIYKEEELTLDLFEIEYTNNPPEKPVAPITYNTVINDNSTNYSRIKGSNINSDGSKIEKKTEVNVELEANLKKH